MDHHGIGGLEYDILRGIGCNLLRHVGVPDTALSHGHVFLCHPKVAAGMLQMV